MDGVLSGNGIAYKTLCTKVVSLGLRFLDATPEPHRAISAQWYPIGAEILLNNGN